MSETVTANDGVQLPLNDLNQNFVYSGGFISQSSCIYRGKTYLQIFLNDGTDIIFISSWTAVASGQNFMVTESGAYMLTEDGNLMLTE